MECVDNNQLEVKPGARTKRKISAPSPAAYANPALDLLAADDAICNTTRELRPKKRKRATSCGDTATFVNTALDLGISRVAVSEFLVTELENVKRNLKPIEEIDDDSEPRSSPVGIDDASENMFKESENITLENETPNTASNIFENINVSAESQCFPVGIVNVCENMYTNSANVTQGKEAPQITNQIFINNQTNLSLSFIDRLALDSPGVSNQSLYLDDDLNESNIMEIKTITIITKKKHSDVRPKSTNPFLNSSDDDVGDLPTNGNPFSCLPETSDQSSNGHPEDLDLNMESIEIYNDESRTEPLQPNYTQIQPIDLVPRRLFITDTNSTISTVNDLSITNVENQNEYENIDSIRADSPIYANIDEVYAANENYNKQSKILGHDVSNFNSRDILNLNRRRQMESHSTQSLDSNERSDSKKSRDLSHQINKLSKKVLKKLKKTFIGDKTEHNMTLNPYEVPRKVPKVKVTPKTSGVENPALNLDNSDEVEEIEDDDHLYETVKTARNTRLNMNVTPLRECNRGTDSACPLDTTGTPGRKHVRFDSTLNREKVITGNSFDGQDVISPGLDSKIDTFHDELENCINEKKFIAQIM